VPIAIRLVSSSAMYAYLFPKYCFITHLLIHLFVLYLVLILLPSNAATATAATIRATIITAAIPQSMRRQSRSRRLPLRASWVLLVSLAWWCYRLVILHPPLTGYGRDFPPLRLAAYVASRLKVYVIRFSCFTGLTFRRLCGFSFGFGLYDISITLNYAIA